MKDYQSASFLFVTYNRCPFKTVAYNPLYLSLTSLINNVEAENILKEILIVIDGCTDYTQATIKKVEDISSIKIRKIVNKQRKGCSFSRAIGIRSLKTEMFFMGDDDCLYKPKFLKNCLEAWHRIEKKDQQIAVLTPPILEADIGFRAELPNNLIGYWDYPKAWFDHNFDCLPKTRQNNQTMEIQTFKGVSLNRKSSILGAGNFCDLSMWDNDYSEHIELSYRLKMQKYTFYYYYDLDAAAIHLKYGREVKIKSSFCHYYLPGIRDSLGIILARSIKSNLNSGCKVDDLAFDLNKIGSFFSFFLKVDKQVAKFFLRTEYQNFLQAYGQIPLNQKQTIFKDVLEKAFQVTYVQTGQKYDNIKDNFYDIFSKKTD